MDWIKSFWEGLAKLSSEGAVSPLSVDQFTPRAKEAFKLARGEAESFHHNFIGPEHVLLGLIKLRQGVAVNVLTRSNVKLESLRMEIEKQVGAGGDEGVSDMRPTPRVMKVLSIARMEATALSHTYVGTEHILLGLLRESDCMAARVLKSLGVDLEQTRQMILKELEPNFPPGDNEQKGPD